MTKEKFVYNPNTLSYEPVVVSKKKRLWQVLGLMGAFLMSSAIIVGLAFQLIDSPKEKQLNRELEIAAIQYEQVNKTLDQYNNVLNDLQDRDDNIYRVIFEADPIPTNVRQAGVGGTNRYAHLEGISNEEIITETSKKLDQMGRKIFVQSKSYDELATMIQRKEELLLAIPAIQPVSNRNLKRMASGFGYRMDPIYKTKKFHRGMDFSAPIGTQVFSTGTGVVSKVSSGKNGYGKHIIIDHGFNYKTLYAHLSEISVKKGQEVARGDEIGEVGSTGKSTAPHLHYEVIKNGKHVNPINYYFNDLSSADYERLTEMLENSNQSFD